MNIELEELARKSTLPKNDIKEDVDGSYDYGDLLSILELLNEPGVIM